MRFSEEGLYRLLEKILREADQPLHCNELWDKFPELREHAASPNRVSDYLGNLWRRGLLSRVASGAEGRGPRWSYIWKDKVPPQLAAIGYVPKALVERPSLLISEEGDTIQIDLKEFVIIIQQRKKPK